MLSSPTKASSLLLEVDLAEGGFIPFWKAPTLFLHPGHLPGLPLSTRSWSLPLRSRKDLEHVSARGKGRVKGRHWGRRSGPGVGDKLLPAPQFCSEPALGKWDSPISKIASSEDFSPHHPRVQIPPFLWRASLFYSDPVVDHPEQPQKQL